MTVTVHNKILRVLRPEDLNALHPMLEVFPLKPKRILHHAKLPIEHVYFVELGLISVLANTDAESHGVEAWLIGSEGLAGVPVVLGGATSPHRRMVQGEGMALRMRTEDLLHAMTTSPALRTALLQYVNSVLIQVGQLSACNARHTVPQRLARWLLMAHDRYPTDDVPLTHDIIAKMLGVRRPSVTSILGALARTGAVSPGRGHVHVTDRGELERHSCGCYGVMKTEFGRVLGVNGDGGVQAGRYSARVELSLSGTET